MQLNFEEGVEKVKREYEYSMEGRTKRQGVNQPNKK